MEYLKEYLIYDPDNGKFFWKKESLNKARKVGEEAGSYAGNGYSIICVENKRFSGHRLAWYFYYGEWPDFHIDHMDGDKQNNKINNLRKSNPSVNMKNRGLNKNNTTGYSGIQKSRNKWRVRVRIDGKLLNFGTYDNIEDAVRVRNEVYIEYGFHPNHGKRESWS